MFLLNEYQNFIVHPHMKEKTLFYDLQPYRSPLIDNINIKFKIFFDVFDKKLFIGTVLFFYTFLASTLRYKNISFNNYICYDFNISISSLYKFNIFYHSFLSFSYGNYSNSFLVQDFMHKDISVLFKSLSNFPSSTFFYEMTSLNTLLHFSFHSHSNSFFYNKLYLSHFFVNTY